MPTSLSYIVCATHRSGSSLVCQALWHSGIGGYPQEFFSPTQAPKIAREYDLGVDPAADFPAYVSRLLETRHSPNGVFGAKIMWRHLDPMAESLGLPTGDPVALYQHWLELFPALRLVAVRRADKVRQAISLWKAKQTKIYNSLQIGKREQPAEPPRFDFEEIRKIRDRFTEEEESWSRFFDQIGASPATVVYEDFAPRHEEAARELLSALGVSIPDDLSFQPLTYQKQADSLNEEWYARFLEIESGAATTS